LIEEVIENGQETIEVGGKQYPLWEIVRDGGKLYCKEISIFPGIDGKKIPAKEMKDDWLHAGRLKGKADRGAK